jgi:hypothetical protein
MTLKDIATKVRDLEKDRRENPKSVLDVNPDGVVAWSEVVHMIKDAGLWTNAIDTREDFQKAYDAV